MRLNTAFILAVVLIALLFCTVDAKKKAASKPKNSADTEGSTGGASSKVGALVKLLSSSPVIPLSDKNFTKFVTDRPRDYHAVLLFTATGKQYQCGVCVKTQGVYEEIAGLYNAQYDFNKTDIEKKVVFFKIEVDNARAIFTELQLETVPRLFFLPPAAVGAPKAQISKFEVDNHVLLEGTKRILQEINHITGVKVKLLS